MEASSHATKLGVDAAKRHGAASTDIRLSVCDDLFDQEVDLCSSEKISGAAAKTAKSFAGNIANVLIGVNDQSLPLSVMSSTTSFGILT